MVCEEQKVAQETKSNAAMTHVMKSSVVYHNTEAETKTFE